MSGPQLTLDANGVLLGDDWLTALQAQQAQAEFSSWMTGIERTAAEIAALPLAADDDQSLWDACEPDDDYRDEGEHDAWIASLPPDIRALWQSAPWTGDGEAFAAGFLHHDRDSDYAGGDGFASGGIFDVLPPGPDLASHTAAAARHGAELGESELIGVLCAWQRLTSWAQAGQAAALSILTDRRKVQSVERQSPSLAAHLDDEVAAALALTGHAAARLLQVSSALAGLPGVHAALAAGRIDWAKACVFADELAGLPGQDAADIADAVLSRGCRRTTGQLRASLARAVLAYDPGAAQRKREAARKDASVQLWHEPSGNDALSGRELEPADAIHASTRLTALARWLQKNGATGTTDQLRAAVFIALLSGRSVESLLPVQSGDGSSGDRAGGSSDDDGDSSASAESGSQPTAANWPPASGTAPGAGGWPQVAGTINLTMPLSAWLGLTHSPGELAGYGPADAATCRDLAAAAGTAARWCLTLTDAGGRAVAHACARRGPPPAPGPGTIAWAAELTDKLQYLETGTCSHARRADHYRPPASLMHLVRIRQRTCTFAGCRRPAPRGDMDHTTAYHKGGLTCECNLAPLCRRHHQAKQAAGWRLTQRQPGVMTWTLPHGRNYTTVGDPYPV